MFLAVNRSCLQLQLQQLALCQLHPHLWWPLQQPLQLLSKVQWTKWRLRTQNRHYSLMPWQMVSWHILYRYVYRLFNRIFNSWDYRTISKCEFNSFHWRWSIVVGFLCYQSVETLQLLAQLFSFRCWYPPNRLHNIIIHSQSCILPAGRWRCHCILMFRIAVVIDCILCHWLWR